MNTQSAQEKLDDYIAKLGERRPRLLLHACCAPCSAWPLSCLSDYFDITLYFYNPNMDTQEEFEKRAAELKRLLQEMSLQDKVKLVIAPYDHEAFEQMAKGLEEEPERGRRCLKCYELRLAKAADYMKTAGGFDHFATTLTLSPLKNASVINEIGNRLAGDTSVSYLETDFKKKNGYLHSIELSKQYDLYRQNYCGCRYSKKQACGKTAEAVPDCQTEKEMR